MGFSVVCLGATDEVRVRASEDARERGWMDGERKEGGSKREEGVYDMPTRGGRGGDNISISTFTTKLFYYPAIFIPPPPFFPSNPDFSFL